MHGDDAACVSPTSTGSCQQSLWPETQQGQQAAAAAEYDLQLVLKS